MNISRTLAAFFSAHQKFLQKNSPILLVIFLSALALATISFQHQEQKKAEGERNTVVVAPEDTPAYPVHLSIPAIEVEAKIQHIGLTPSGAMDVPSNIIDVGWFKYGATPGTEGSAVIAGHFNGENNEAGVFARLNTLKEGDRVTVTNSESEILTFEVKAVRDYDPGRADEVFTQNDRAHLNLVTCEGAWDEKTKSYSKRRVVFTDLVE